MSGITQAWRTLRARRGRPFSRPMSRDKSDTLLLLFACAMVLAPYAQQLPLWISGIAIVLLLWRSWITFRGNRMPSRWLLLPLAVAAMGGIYLQFRTFLGQEAGVATLILLLTFKLLEMRARRDLFVVIFLSFFLLLTRFFESQTMASAAMTLISVIVLLAAQLSFQYTGSRPPLGKRLRTAAMIVGLAAPLTIVLFVLFPRIQGPLWGMPGDSQIARSGLSNTMSPGNISQLALSEEVAFRVRFLDREPDRNTLYWRGIVLGLYDGQIWRRDATQGRNADPISFTHSGPGIRYEITQEANRQPWLFALELPATIPQLNNNRVRMTPDIQLAASRPITERIRYEVTSHPDSALQRNAAPASLKDWLSLPANYHPRTIALAQRMRAEHADDRARIQAVLGMFRTQPFRYTLQPPLLDGDNVDAFLFSTRAGFCEHYASAFVVLMRAMGIPARVVTGYQGGQMNPVDGFMTVRQSDAHAWSEVWLAGRGWTRVDPTAAVAPERIERNATNAPQTATEFGGLVNFGQHSFLRDLRFRWEALNNGWNQWVLSYTPERQKSLLSTLGFGNINWQKMILLMAIAAGVVILLMTIPLFMQRRRLDPVDALYAGFCKRMARQGLARAPHEGPRAYADRLQAAGTLTDHTQRIAQQFLICYEEYRYGRNQSQDRSVTRTTLHSLLKQIR